MSLGGRNAASLDSLSVSLHKCNRILPGDDITSQSSCFKSVTKRLDIKGLYSSNKTCKKS